MSTLEKRIPRLVEGVTITSLPIDAMEGFVLSRVDGRVDLADIGDLTGFGAERVGEIVDKLIGLGAVTWGDDDDVDVHGKTERPPPGAGLGMPDPIPTAPPLREHRSEAPPPSGAKGGLYDPRELEEEVDLEMARRRQVLDTFYRLDDYSHYSILGVPEDAAKADIRAAYFALSKVFHPDTLFGKNLGSFKAKMERVFKHLTEAYEVLGKKRNRKEYDAYLILRKATMAAQRSMDVGEQLAQEIERESSIPPEPPPESRPGRAPAHRPPSEEQILDRKRRTMQAMARRLQRSLRPPSVGVSGEARPPSVGSAPSSRPPSTPAGHAPATREHVLRNLTRSLKGAASHTGGVDKATRQLRAALDLEKKGELVEAVNALRLAQALDADRLDIGEELERVSLRLAETMADTYMSQAKYEEKAGKMEAAALSWMRVREGRPGDIEPARHAARCFLDANGDMRKAKLMAQEVVDSLPEDVEARILLARIYEAAGMRANAKREAETAATLDPGHEFVKNLLRQLK